jgi:hypothetical protein
MSKLCDMSFGFPNDDIDVVAKLLAEVFKLKWTSRYSQHAGGAYYFAPGLGEEEFMLMNNRDVMDGEPLDEADPDEYPIVLAVGKTQRSAEIKSLIGSVEGSLLIRTLEYSSFDPD